LIGIVSPCETNLIQFHDLSFEVCRSAHLAVPSGDVKLRLLDSFTRTHHGLVTRAEAEGLGISRASWYRAIDAGHLEPLYPNVARVWGSPTTFEQRVLAAVWAAGTTALASHRSSAALWGVERPDDDPIDVLLPGRRRHSLPSGIIIHRPSDSLDLRPILRHGIPTTNPMRMLLDLGAVDPAAVYDAMITVMASKAASPSVIRAALVRHAKRGRHGTMALRLALEQWLGEELPPDSALEAAMASAALAHRLPPITFHAMVSGYEVDFLVDGTNIVIECDGWGTHGLDRDQFEFDRLRDGDLAAAGYVVLHITWRQLVDDPAKVATRIRDVVRRWAPHLV
jgi:very-short-patch-repair endonuclease